MIKGSSYGTYYVKCNECDNQGGLEPPELLGDLGDLIPSCASCSKKSDQSSARDSFLVPPSGKKSVDKAGVLGVLCHGDKGTRRFGFDAPGRARPACSRCSTVVSEQSLVFGAQKSALPSVQASRFAIICNTWNFFGSALSRAKK